MSGFRYQIYDVVSGEPHGVPYRYICRCLMRVRELNIFEQANRFSLKPVRVKE